MTTAWVMGSGGLLGAALCRALRRDGTALFFPEPRLAWSDPVLLESAMADAVQAFASRLGPNEPWQLYWAAGVGTMSSAADELLPETNALNLLLRLLAANQRLMALPGGFGFASSAGAIYAGSGDGVITEDTVAQPTTPYALKKLEQEKLVQTFADSRSTVTAVNFRISTIYGPGQSAGKKQGLLTHMARQIIRNQLIQIYVPYDTIRDYISADDAGAAMVRALRAALGSSHTLLKIIASEQPTTIATIVSTFRRIARRTPRIVTSASRLTSLYSRRVQFRSIALPELSKTPCINLSIGIAQLMTAERASFVQGSGSGNSRS